MAHECRLKMATSHVHVRTVALLGLPETGREPFDASPADVLSTRVCPNSNCGSDPASQIAVPIDSKGSSMSRDLIDSRKSVSLETVAQCMHETQGLLITGAAHMIRTLRHLRHVEHLCRFVSLRCASESFQL